MAWYPIDDGATLGKIVDEGVAELDEEYDGCARITLQLGSTVGAEYAITCGIYGWMAHTRYFSSRREAVEAYEQMKPSLAEIVDACPLETDANLDARVRETGLAISRFVERFP